MESNLPFLNDGKFHDINLGRTFLKRDTAFHTLRYDFKPASVDVDQPGQVEVGEGNEVTIILPHTEGSKNPSTTYKGSKKPALKECILIYDEDTGSFTLERITSQIQVKKTRIAGNIKLPPLKSVDAKPSKIKKPIHSPSVETQKFELPTMQNADRSFNLPSTTQESDYRDILANSMSEIKKSSALSSSDDDSSSSGSSSSDDSSDVDSEPDLQTTPVTTQLPHNDLKGQLADDLMLSESSSSDSD